MSDTRYNGWTNYETWCVNLWMDNEQGAQESVREMGQQELDTAGGDKEEAALRLADSIEAMHDDGMAELTGVTGVFSDLLRASLGAVNWYEIAESVLSDLDYTQEE